MKDKIDKVFNSMLIINEALHELKLTNFRNTRESLDVLLSGKNVTFQDYGKTVHGTIEKVISISDEYVYVSVICHSYWRDAIQLSTAQLEFQ